MKIDRLTFFYNDVDSQYGEMLNLVEKTGISYGPLPTSGCLTLWVRNEQCSYAYHGPTAIRKVLNSILEQKVEKVA